MDPPRVRFVGNGTGSEAERQFRQRIIDGRFIAAVGVHPPADLAQALWEEVPPDQWADHHLLRVSS